MCVNSKMIVSVMKLSLPLIWIPIDVDLFPPGAAGSSWQIEPRASDLGLYPIFTSQYTSTTLYQVYYHIQYQMFF